METERVIDTSKAKSGAKPIIELQGISKNFGSVQALQNINCSFYEDEVVGLVGDNGAGKSTLVKIIAGVFRQDAGKILVDSIPVTRSSK